MVGRHLAERGLRQLDGSKPVEKWKPEWRIDLGDVQSNAGRDGARLRWSARADPVKASTPAEIDELFDGIAYEKGAAVIRMIERWLGEEAFRKGVNAYIDKFKYGNARAEEFWSTVAHTAGKPVDQVMKSFVDQPGVPLVSVKVNCTGSTGSVAVTQERYVRDGSAAADAQLWSIPVCVRTPNGKTTCSVVSQKNATIALDSCPQWVMPNAGARGYYRMGYSPEMLRALAPHVETLEPSERIALLDDEWALVRAGRHDVGSFLDLASGFGAERNSDVLQTLTGTLALIDRAADDRGQPAGLPGLAIAAPEAGAPGAGWSPQPGEPEDASAARAALIGTLGGVARDPEVLARARELVLQELAQPGSLKPEIVNVVVNLAAIGGDQALYDKYLARSRAVADPEEKYRYLNALTSFTDPALVRKTMDLVLEPEVRNQDAKLFLAGMLGSLDTQRLAWELIQARWDDIQKKTGEFVGNTVIVGGLSAFCDTRTGEEAKAFFAKHPVPDAQRTLQQALERIDSCVTLSRAQGPKLTAWLTAQ